MIDLPPLGNLNLHASLLPKYRGAAPIQWAIAMGERITGVTTMRIDAGLDTGDILMQSEERIGTEDTAMTLAPRLAQGGAELMICDPGRAEERHHHAATAGQRQGHAGADPEARRRAH
jgi:methionyl-tRNA formyltransferase